ncbi:hypothetical protein NDU88_001779 [Pleurodeles waltl]|uniref:Uncharacterized protein n=1 Tax=Pleurodeles waltl TaxID=8319 RepID=A0AAV7Q6Y8_PLEWA|nr:hypothetical protein NDU88_001779 [Pleurodeles waltl]
MHRPEWQPLSATLSHPWSSAHRPPEWFESGVTEAGGQPQHHDHRNGPSIPSHGAGMPRHCGLLGGSIDAADETDHAD